MNRSLLVLTAALLLSFSADAKLSKAEAESKKLTAVVTTFTEAAKRFDAYSAPYFGIKEDLGKFGDYTSPAYYKRMRSAYDAAAKGLKKVHLDQLDEKNRRTYLLFSESISNALRGFEFSEEIRMLGEFNQLYNRMSVYVDDADPELTYFPFKTKENYLAFVQRGEQFPAFVELLIASLRKAIRTGIVHGCAVAAKVPQSYERGLESVPEKSPFWKPVTKFDPSISSTEQTEIRKSFEKMITVAIAPAYRKFDAFFKAEYLPKCRPGYGVGGLPRGAEWYKLMVLSSTDLELSPAEIHETGKKEVARILAEMDAIRTEVRFSGNLRAFMASLATDEKYFFKSRTEMLAAFESIRAKVDQQAPKYFSTIPKSPYKLVEASSAESPAGSYYSPTDDTPYGRFMMNTKNLKSTPTFGVTTLLLHEAVPGHHFQLALAFEMKDELSEYQRKLYSSNSFTEGWALYAEYLGREMGLFEDPMQRVGNLADELFRAVRLVVDTGIHHYGWSREKTLEYMKDHLAADAKDSEVEADRYSVWPGQALGYKVGQLKILELRRFAEKALGQKFDLKAFHGVVIGTGPISLKVLDSQVKAWVAKTANPLPFKPTN